MSARGGGKSTEFNNESILQFVRKYEEPCITAGEIADHFGVTNGAVRYRMNQLIEAEKIREKEVGASATVYYPIG